MSPRLESLIHGTSQILRLLGDGIHLGAPLYRELSRRLDAALDAELGRRRLPLGPPPESVNPQPPQKEMP